MRSAYYTVSLVGLAAIGLLSLVWPSSLYLLFLLVPYIAVGLYDVSSKHNVLRNYPVIGHLRYLLEFISPEIQQYFIETNQSGRPYNRQLRSLIYQRAYKLADTLPFGTQRDITDQGYEFAHHSLTPKKPRPDAAVVVIGGPQCDHPYRASRLNISAMSFGALSANAIRAMNKGARLGGFAQNTGEGGLSPYHLEFGADIVWQIGTGYFGCRTPDGRFNADEFQRKAALDNVKMIEVKLSQGAKPSHGGILPAAKVSAEIARIRGVPMGEDCISPPAHPAFSTPVGLLQFVARLRELAGGKPVGFKLCVGVRREFLAICKAMLQTSLVPDFITVDGAEGGTGAAPVEFSDNLGASTNEAVAFVHSCLVGIDLRERTRIIASGKVATGFDLITKLALGADLCNVARPMMFAVGCIQALRCNKNTCPTGVTSQDPRRAWAIDIESKHLRVRNYHAATLISFLDLMRAMGCCSPDELAPSLIYRRLADGSARPYSELYTCLMPGELLASGVHPDYVAAWDAASPEHF